MFLSFLSGLRACCAFYRLPLEPSTTTVAYYPKGNEHYQFAAYELAALITDPIESPST